MNGFSPKVTAATVAASTVSVIGGIVGPYVFPNGTPADVKGLALAVVTAGVTFASGYLTKHPALEHDVEAAVSVAEELGKPFSQVAEYIEPFVPAPAPVVPQAPAAPVIYPPQ